MKTAGRLRVPVGPRRAARRRPPRVGVRVTAPLPDDEATALVHDYLLVMRGAERTFAAIADLWPRSPIYTLLYDEAGTWSRFSGRQVSTSPLQRLGVRQNGFRHLLPLFPAAARRLPVGSAKLVVSSSSAFAHGVRPAPEAAHVCYCHSPFRYAWHERSRALAELPRGLRGPLRLGLQGFRRWDLASTPGVTHYIANSEITRRRIQDYWGREASVLHPPVDVERFQLAEPEDFLLVVTELVPHKRVDLALEAARRAERPIKVVGTGPETARLSRLYAGDAEFLGRLPDHDLASVYARALALVVPGVEEFGIAAVEAQAAGRPVVAVGSGGVTETVRDGTTGVLVPSADADSLAEAIRYTDFRAFSPERTRRHASGFARAVFQRRFRAEVERIAGSQPFAAAGGPSAGPAE